MHGARLGSQYARHHRTSLGSDRPGEGTFGFRYDPETSLRSPSPGAALAHVCGFASQNGDGLLQASEAASLSAPVCLGGALPAQAVVGAQYDTSVG